METKRKNWKRESKFNGQSRNALGNELQAGKETKEKKFVIDFKSLLKKI